MYIIGYIYELLLCIFYMRRKNSKSNLRKCLPMFTTLSLMCVCKKKKAREKKTRGKSGAACALQKKGATIDPKFEIKIKGCNL